MNDNVKACPDCGRVVLHHCWHEGDKVPSQLMNKEIAKQKRLQYYEQLLVEAEDLLEEGDLNDGEAI